MTDKQEVYCLRYITVGSAEVLHLLCDDESRNCLRCDQGANCIVDRRHSETATQEDT